MNLRNLSRRPKLDVDDILELIDCEISDSRIPSDSVGVKIFNIVQTFTFGIAGSISLISGRKLINNHR